jgi:hypothetical protein
MFGAGNSYGLRGSDGDPALADQIMVLDPLTQATSSYYFSTFDGENCWLNSVTFESAGDVLLYPERGLIVKVVGPDVNVYYAGQVQTRPVAASVFGGFNVMAVIDPLKNVDSARLLSLANSGLFTGSSSTGVKASAQGLSVDADMVYVLDTASQVVSTSFYSTFPGDDNWLDTNTFDVVSNVTVSAGRGFYIYRRGTTPLHGPSLHRIWSFPDSV